LLTQFGPVIAKTLTLPGNHRPCLDKKQSIPPPRPAAREPRPENTVSRANLRAFGCSLIHSKLMPQCHNLELQGNPRTDHGRYKQYQRATMGFIVLDPNNDRGHQIDIIPEKGQEYQAVRIFGKDRSMTTAVRL
jgi:hypothetical protein